MKTISTGATLATPRTVETIGWRLSTLARQTAICATYALFIMLPLAYTGSTSDMFDIPKLVSLRLLTIIALLALVAVGLAKRKVVLGRTALDVPLLAYLAVMIAATVNSVSPINSLNGEYTRYDGLYTSLNYVVVFLLATHVLQRRRVSTALTVMVLTALVVALESLAEHLGGGALLAAAQFFGGRPTAFLGNPDFLGTYLMLALPIAVGLLLTSPGRLSRLGWGSVVVVLAAALAVTYTRAAWLGFLAGVPVFLIEWRVLAKRVLWLLALVVALILSLALLGVLPLFPGGDAAATQNATPSAAGSYREESILDRAVSTGNIRSGTAANRILIWVSALPLLTEHPILGTGPNTFRAVITRHLPSAYSAGEGRDRDPDRAHNGYLHLAVTTGLLGLGTYLIVLAAFGLMMWRWLRREGPSRARVLGVAILSAWLGYVVQDFFLFGVLGSASQWWLLMGLAAALSATPGQQPRVALALPRPAIVRALAGIAAITLAAYLAVGSVRLWLADYTLEQAQSAFRQSLSHGQPGQSLLHAQPELPFSHGQQGTFDPEPSLQRYREAIALAPDQGYYYEVFASALAAAAHSVSRDGGPERRYLDEAIRAMNTAVNLDPLFATLYLRRGAFYEMYGTEHQLDAFKDYRKVVSLYPNSYFGNTGLAEAARRIGSPAEAIGAQRAALAVVPDDRPGRINLGIDYATVGRFAEAEQLLEGLLALNPTDADARFALGFTFEKQGQKERALAEYQTVLDADPRNERARGGIARVENPGPPSAGHPPIGGTPSGS